MPANPLRAAVAPTRTPSSRPGVVPYDFRRPTKLSREHIRMLQIAYGTFARRLTTLLTSGLRQVCTVTVTEISQQSYEEYITGLESQTLVVPFAAPPLAGTCVLEFSLPVALAAVDYMLGGPGGEQLPRQLTDIEATLLRGLIEQLIGVLRYSLEPIISVTPDIGLIEYNPQFVQAATATDAMIVADFEMVVGSERCRLTLCMPLAPLLPVLITKGPRNLEDEGPDATFASTQIRERLGEVPLEVSVEFQPLPLSPARILRLKEGDLVVLHHRVGVPLTVRAGGTSYAHGIAGRAGNRLAALIVDTPEEIK